MIKIYIKLANHVIKANKKDFISFNRWFKDYNYRRQIEHDYGLINTDRGINTVSPVGEGSTFDKFAYDNRAQEMPVFNRWELVKDDPEYMMPLKEYPELANISRKLFDFEPPDCLKF
jgi:hypothetical protein